MLSGIGVSELLLLFVIGLLILGPERLPRVASQLGRWVGKARRTANQLRFQMEREIALADIEKISKKKEAPKSGGSPSADTTADAEGGTEHSDTTQAGSAGAESTNGGHTGSGAGSSTTGSSSAGSQAADSTATTSTSDDTAVERRS